MLGLLILPALLGLALIVNIFDDDDDTSAERDDTPAEPEVVEDGYIGTDASENPVSGPDGGYINGGGGNDSITGSDNDDGLLGGTGNDVIYGRGGSDTVSGDAGNDRVFLGDGDDFYTPDDTSANTAGEDVVHGGAGNDLISDLRGSNTLYGDQGRDTLVAFDDMNVSGDYLAESERGTTDTLSGGFGNDLLAGDDGDVMTGGAGSDAFWVVDDEDHDQEEVHITDFDTDEDTLFVTLRFGGLSPEPVGLAYDAEAGAVRATYEGRAIAFLEGLTADDIPAIQTAVVRLADLDRAIA